MSDWKITMPLLPDMEAQKSREIKASFPEDTTTDEFWDFVMLAGTQILGYRKESRSDWNFQLSLSEYLSRKIGPQDEP